MSDTEITKLDMGEVRLPERRKRGRRKDKFASTKVERLTNVEVFAIQLDHKMGMAKTQIAKKWDLTLHQVNKLLKKKIDVTDGLQGHLRKVAFNLMQTVEDIHQSLTPESIQEAGLQSRMIAMGIAVDKTVQISKHLDGTKDNSRAPLIQFADKRELEEAVRRRLDALPVVEEIEYVEDANVVEIEEEEEKQLSLFPGKAEVVTEEKKEEVNWKGVEERNGRLYKKDVTERED